MWKIESIFHEAIETLAGLVTRHSDLLRQNRFEVLHCCCFLQGNSKDEMDLQN